MAFLPPLPCTKDPNPYRILSRKLLFDSPWIRLREDLVKFRSGLEGQYPVCGFRRTACGVLALDEADNVVLVGQWRYPLERYSWEIVEGGGDENETPFDAIRRELAEEAALDAQVWEPLVFFHTSNSSTDEETFLFLATELRNHQGAHRPDQDEELMVHREPFNQCLCRVFNGEITDSLTVVALLALHARRSGKGFPMDLAVSERFFQKPSEHPSAGRARWASLES